MKKISAVVGIMILGLSAFAGSPESQSATGTTSAAVIFAPGIERTVVKSIAGFSDLTQPTITFQARTGRMVLNATTNASSATNIYFVVGENANITNSDTVVFVHDDGTCDYLTVIASAGVTGTNMYFTSGLSKAGKVNDRIYEVSDDFLIDIQGQPTNQANTTNALFSYNGAAIYASPGDSPVRVSVTGSTKSRMSATAEK